MRLYITRHGETLENKAGILQGHSEGTLSETGIVQAEKLSAKLKDEKLGIIYSSDLGRAARTTKIISKHHPHIPLIYTKDLRERDLGEFQGKTRKECGWDIKPGSEYPEPENGEKTTDVFLRAQKFYRYLLDRHINDCLLIVTHGFTGKILSGIIRGITLDDIAINESLNNTSLSIYEIYETGKYHTVSFDSTAHLL